MNTEKKMSFLDHLEELRWRLVKCSVSILAISIVIWWNQEWIMNHVFLSMAHPDFITFKFMHKYFGVVPADIVLNMQNIDLSGQFSYALMTSIMGGVVFSFPYIFYQIWSFVKPGLKQNEKSMASGIIFYVSILFFLGIAFGYLIVAPLCVQFFSTFTMSSQIVNSPTISSYMSMIFSTVFYTGLLFLLPVLSYLLSKLGIITAEFLRKYRKHAIVGVLIIAAAITPPDLISQIIVAIPIILLYEIGILVVVRVEKNKRKLEQTT